MKYNIISINDERKSYKDHIRATVTGTEIDVPAFNGYTHDPIEGATERGIELHEGWGNAKKGEVSIWLSNFDCWQTVAEMDEPLVVFEDDAVPDTYFDVRYKYLMEQMPDDWDFCALWVPENQRQDYQYDVTYELGIPRVHGMVMPDDSKFRIPGKDMVALVYQGYGMVSLVYSPRGGRRLVELTKKYKMYNPVDCWIYEMAHRDEANGYAPRPEHASIVHYDWSAPSHVQITERAL